MSQKGQMSQPAKTQNENTEDYDKILENSSDDSSTADFKIPSPRQSKSDVEEKYIDDAMSSLSHVSDIKVSNAPGKQEYGKGKGREKYF